jgi:hypothetical protein
LPSSEALESAYGKRSIVGDILALDNNVGRSDEKVALLLIIVFLILGSSACGKPTPTPEAAPTLQGKNILMIIARQDFRDEEYKEPRQIFEARGATITVASSSLEIAKGALGAQVKPDLLLEE